MRNAGPRRLYPYGLEFWRACVLYLEKEQGGKDPCSARFRFTHLCRLSFLCAPAPWPLRRTRALPASSRGRMWHANLRMRLGRTRESSGVFGRRTGEISSSGPKSRIPSAGTPSCFIPHLHLRLTGAVGYSKRASLRAVGRRPLSCSSTAPFLRHPANSRFARHRRTRSRKRTKTKRNNPDAGSGFFLFPCPLALTGSRSASLRLRRSPATRARLSALQKGRFFQKPHLPSPIGRKWGLETLPRRDSRDVPL